MASFLQEQCLEQGIVSVFINYVTEHDPSARAPGMAGLANLSYLATIEHKRAIMERVPGRKLHELCCFPDILVSIHASQPSPTNYSTVLQGLGVC